MSELKEDIDYSLEDWKPQKDIGVIFDDKTAENRDKAQIGQMIRKMRDVANEYGFDLNQWGTGHLTGFKKVNK